MLPSLSSKLKSISLLCIIIVLYIHSYNLLIHFREGIHTAYSSFLVDFEDLISQGFGLSAVPLFFGISGYLFFYNSSFTVEFFKKKYLSRVRTLLVPFVLWLGISFFVFFILQTIPGTDAFFKEKRIINFSLSDVIQKTISSPLCYQFWYIRDLILFVLISPILYLFVRYLSYFGLFAIFIVWNLGVIFPVISMEGLLLFCFGAFIAIHQRKFLEYSISKNAICIIGFIYFAFLLAWTFRNQLFCNFSLYTYLRNTCLILGVLFFWFIVDFIPFLWQSKIVASLASRTFFIFAIHEPMLTIIKKLSFLITGTNAWGLLITYLVNPIIVIIIAWLLSSIMKKYIPKVYSVLVGGRG